METTISLDSIITALTSAGGVSVIVSVVAKSFIKKVVSRFEEMSAAVSAMQNEMSRHNFSEMSKNISEIQMKIAVHEAMSEKNRDVKEEVSELRTQLVLLTSKVDAAWRHIDREKR